jgi:hypothetical protein
MINQKYELYLNDFEKKLDLIKDKGSLKLIESDFKNFIENLFSSLNQSVNVREIEEKLDDIQATNLSSLKNALKLFDKKDFKERSITFDKSEIKFLDSYNSLKKLLATIEKNETSLGPAEIILRLEWLGNSAFEQMLYILDSKAPLCKLKEMIQNKLNSIDDNELKIIWAHIKSDFGDQDFNFEYNAEILGKNFFNIKDISDLRSKIADYICELRPKILLARFHKGKSTCPILSFGIATILAIQNSNLNSLTFDELNIAKIINRTAEFWHAAYHIDKNRLFSYLGISPSGRIANLNSRDTEGDMDGNWHDFSEVDISDFRIIICEIRRLLNILDYYVTYQSKIENVLKKYKVKYEIFSKDNYVKFKKKRAPNELYLQKELCAYLHENDIYAYGKSFGRSEIDLIIKNELGEVFVVETKIHKTGKKVGTIEKCIKKDIIQLSEYLDAESTSARGILVIYNLTNAFIERPRIWLQKRFLILPINISEITASERKQSIRIEESDAKNIIKCISLDTKQKS